MRKSLPDGNRPVTRYAIASVRFEETFETVDGRYRGQFMQLIKQVGVRLDLQHGMPAVLRPGVPIRGYYKSGTAIPFNDRRLFTDTTKMPGPSFALPAGPSKFGGTCPASSLGDEPDYVGPDGRRVSPVRDRLMAEIDQNRGDRDPVKLRRLPVIQLGHEGDDDDAGTHGLTPGVQPSYAGDDHFVCRSCLTGDSRVLVRGRGLVPIADLIDAGEFEVWSGVAWRKTSAIFQGVRPVVELTTSWGQVLRLTADHKILTADRGMVEIADISEDDRLIYSPPEEVAWPIRAPLQRRVQPSSTHFNAISDDHLPTEWSYDVGVLLGHILGNGTITRGRYPTVSTVAGEPDRGDLERLQQIVSEWCATSTQIKTHTPAATAFAANPKPLHRIEWRVLALADFVADCGLDKGSIAPEDRRVPSSLWTASVDGVRGFLAGLFGTDGAVSVGKKIELSLSSVSRGLIRDVQQLLFAFGIRSTQCEYTSNRERGYKPLWKLCINSAGSVRGFNEKIGFFNARKQQQLETALAGYDVAAVKRYPHVVSVVELPEPEPVYDLLNVGEEHQFTANGITVSNCYALNGNYMMVTKQASDMMHLAWVEHELRLGGPQRLGTALAYAIQHENMNRAEGFEPYFRIHDAGDFFSPAYLEAWVICASMMTHMRFWAPSRQWVFAKWVPLLASAEQRVRAAGGHLVIRPSVLRIDDPIPMLPGLSAGSGVHMKRMDGCTWMCPVYSLKVPKTQPDGTVKMVEASNCIEASCTACWDAPGTQISYGAH